MKCHPSSNLPFWRVFSISRLSLLLGGLVVILGLVVIFCFWKNLAPRWENRPLDSKQLLSLPDHLMLAGSVKRSQQARYFKFELVNSRSSVTLGLSGRQVNGFDGMLFVFPKTQFPSFWMKEMLFDLDFVWLLDGTVVDLTANVKAPDPSMNLDLLPTYSPSRPVNMVLEVPAGFIDTWQIKLGDKIEFFDQFI